MEAILVREHDVENPDYDPVVHAACTDAGRPYTVPMAKKAPAGTRINHPEAYWLVRLGAAIPGDDECRQASGMTDDQLQKAILAAERLAQGLGYDLPELRKKKPVAPAAAG